MPSDKDYMQLALQQAELAASAGEVPVGAVIVDASGDLVAVGHNLMLQQNDASAHAEIVAIRAAGRKLNNYRLDGCSLFVTLEPCVMCAGAIIHARLQRLVFATRDLQAGAAGSAFNLLHGFPLNHQVQVDEGILQQPAAELLQNFFHARR